MDLQFPVLNKYFYIFIMNAISQYLALFFCVVIVLISCGESGNSNLGNSSSSTGQQENGVCYVPALYPNLPYDISACYEPKNITIDNSSCAALESQIQSQTEWRSACPNSPKLTCPLGIVTIYVYGTDASYMDCDKFDVSDNSSSSSGQQTSSSSGQQLSSSSGQQENGVCYVPALYPNLPYDISACYEPKNIIIDNSSCASLGSQIQGQTEWRSACPNSPKLTCPLEIVTIYVYGADASNVNCNNLGASVD
jgi:hypothetical protein